MYFEKIRINEARIIPAAKGVAYFLKVNGRRIGLFDNAYLKNVKGALQDYGIQFTNAIPMREGGRDISVTFRGGEWIYIEFSDEVYEEYEEDIEMSWINK